MRFTCQYLRSSKDNGKQRTGVLFLGRMELESAVARSPLIPDACLLLDDERRKPELLEACGEHQARLTRTD
jgi:hypothetical protein